uniref:CSON013671 protein n=1 Tax=Culicoides sonorensis TaxID=179676 RepID=A0A336LUU8_CULSO
MVQNFLKEHGKASTIITFKKLDLKPTEKSSDIVISEAYLKFMKGSAMTKEDQAFFEITDSQHHLNMKKILKKIAKRKKELENKELTLKHSQMFNRKYDEKIFEKEREINEIREKQAIAKERLESNKKMVEKLTKKKNSSKISFQVKMESAIRLESTIFQCCVACLREDVEVIKEPDIPKSAINIYNILVQDQLYQLGMSQIDLCSSCIHILKNIMDFRIQCLSSVEYLSGKLEISTVYCENQEEDIFKIENKEKKLSITNHNKLDVQEKKTKNSQTQCVKKMKNKKTLEKFDINFLNRKEYQNHLLEHSEKKQNVCEYCDTTFRNTTVLKYHVMAVHQGALRCRFCHKAFFDKDEYGEHINNEIARMQDRKYFCDLCAYETRYKTCLWIHMKKYHAPDQPLIICNECGKSYKTKEQFISHQKSSHLDKKHQCSECGKKFAYATTMRKHIKLSHTLEGAFENCKICGKNMRTSSIRVHMASVHQQIRKFNCDQCTMVFKTPGTLKKHKHTHSKTRPFNCNLCTTGYYCNEYLRKHFERVHGIVYTAADIRKICGMKELDFFTKVPKTL